MYESHTLRNDGDASMLNGQRLYLRPPLRDELTYIQRLWSDPETMADVGGVQLLDDVRAIRWFERWVHPGDPSRFYCLVFRKEDHQPVGEAYFYNFDPKSGTAMYGMNIEATHRGRGYASEVLRIMTTYFFTKCEGNVLMDNIALDNVRGQRALLRFGFEPDPSLGSDAFWVKLTRERFFRLHSIETEADTDG
ncbi:GNAT family N-acetyltransferase [Alicyclobacillus macrosporangiidus]|uniref:GNAT family N-acetyltransferase n=1 Tax=Alicyclobacillus macrosporangiidus TaxID=392015 RepID=UPI000496C2BC|nr:GNAT family N-acetyltransferase [Alicyclobacillus macrosporangiidus]